MRKGLGPIWLVLTIIGLLAVPYFIVLGPDFGFDSHAYWSIDVADPYPGLSALDEPNAFLYSPPAALLASFFHYVPWPVFLWSWTALLFLAVGWLGRWRWGLAMVAFAPVAMEIHYGNINLLLAVAIAASWRWPALWTVVLLTKPSAAIGLLYPLIRARLAGGRHPALDHGGRSAPLSAVVRPDLWVGYVNMLIEASAIPEIIPLLPRLPVAAAVVIWGALTNRRWTVPVAAAIALPQSWWTNFALLTAVPRSLDKPLLPELARWRDRLYGRKAPAAVTQTADAASEAP